MNRILTPILTASLLALSACGFQPVYADRSAAGENGAQADVVDEMGRVSIANIPDRQGQYLRNALIDRLYQHGRPQNPAYTLIIDPLIETLTDLDITKTSTATRSQLRLVTRLRLKDHETDQIVLDRPLTAITSYNVLQSQFTTRVSEENARENALDDLARQTEAQLALYFRRTP